MTPRLRENASINEPSSDEYKGTMLNVQFSRVRGVHSFSGHCPTDSRWPMLARGRAAAADPGGMQMIHSWQLIASPWTLHPAHAPLPARSSFAFVSMSVISPKGKRASPLRCAEGCLGAAARIPPTAPALGMPWPPLPLACHLHHGHGPWRHERARTGAWSAPSRRPAALHLWLGS